MKVTFKYGIGTYSGTADGMTYWGVRSGLGSIGRLWVMPKLTSQNETLGNISKNLAVLWADASPEYHADMKTYAERRFVEAADPTAVWDPVRSPYACFTHMMWAWQAADPEHVDLATLTAMDVDTLGSGLVDTVMNAVDAGYLWDITSSDDLTASW